MFSPLAKFPIEARIDNSLLISFGLMLAIDNLAAMIWTADERIVTTPLSGTTFGIFGLRVPYVGLISLGLTLLFAFSLHLFLYKTRFGKAIRATSQDWEAATTLGVNIGYTYLISFGISTALAGIAGALLSLNYAFNPSISEGWSIKALIIITLGWLGSDWWRICCRVDFRGCRGSQRLFYRGLESTSRRPCSLHSPPPLQATGTLYQTSTRNAGDGI